MRLVVRLVLPLQPMSQVDKLRPHRANRSAASKVTTRRILKWRILQSARKSYAMSAGEN